MRTWMRRAWIPNRAGYRVTLLLRSGELREETVVVRDGIHTLSATPITAVAAWRPR